MSAAKSALPRSQALKLLRAAAQVSRNAHAPYSAFQVGAALLTDTGAVISGCNVENASYGLTICAERNAIFHAVAVKKRKFKAVAIVASGKQMPFPCGACRQVLAEFGSPEMVVLVAPRAKLADYMELTLGELLPHSFKF
ncbi:MAG: cytidine deaminase [Kiritimatiellae bacterium]|nr:cytidine deaminase [Kiritimatiellia bacterium]